MDDQIFAAAMKRIAKVFTEGAETHRLGTLRHWRSLTSRDHLLHAAKHVSHALLDVKTGEDDIACAFVRLLFAMQLEREASNGR